MEKFKKTVLQSRPSMCSKFYHVLLKELGLSRQVPNQSFCKKKRQKGESNELKLSATEIMRARDLGLEAEAPFVSL